MSGICKNCKRYKPVNSIEKVGTCEVIVTLPLFPDDMDMRIIHKSVDGFLFERSKVWVGENFGCIHFMDKSHGT